MMGIITLSKEQVGNLALGRLGDYGNIMDIDNPSNDNERSIAKWWDIARHVALKEIKPNFALHRVKIAEDSEAPAFGYSHRYRKPADCVAVLGFGDVQDAENVYSVEGEYILTDEYAGEALPLRYVRDVEDVTKWSSEFVDTMSYSLASFVNMEITGDIQKQSGLERLLPGKKSSTGALSGQENKPVRVTRSLFEKAKVSHRPSNTDKR